MDVVNYQKSGREKDRQGRGMRSLLLRCRSSVDIQRQRIEQDKLRQNDGGTLEVDCGPAIEAQVLDIEQSWLNE